MLPEFKQCGICDEEQPIGMSIFCWPEDSTVHVCVQCCIEWFPTYLSLPKKGIDGYDGLKDIIKDIISQSTQDTTMCDSIRFDPSSEKAILNVKRWINHEKK